jgi:large subunit ribosomal protein L9
MATKLLLLEDVEALGRSGDVVSVRPGFARNYLLPQGFGVTADKQTLRRQEKLKQERQKKAIEDKHEAQILAGRMEGTILIKVVKVDQEGQMYGSVTQQEIAHLLADHLKIELERKNVQLKHAIKQTGMHSIIVRLKEGVTASFQVHILSEEQHKALQKEEKTL